MPRTLYQALVKPLATVKETTQPDKWLPLPNQPYRVLENRNHLAPPTALTDTKQQTLKEVVHLDKFHPLIEQRILDLPRLQYLDPWFWNDDFAVTQAAAPVVLPDRYTAYRPDIIFDAKRLQYLDPSLVQDTRALTLHESVFPDKWHPEIQRPPADLLHQHFTWNFLSQHPLPVLSGQTFYGLPTAVEMSTTATNDFSADGFTWADVNAVVVDKFNRIFLSIQRYGAGTHTNLFIYSNDGGTTWNDGLSETSMLRASIAYDSVNDVVHVLWAGIDMTSSNGVIYRRYTITRDGANNITAFVKDTTVNLQLDFQQSSAVMSTDFPKFIWMNDAAFGTFGALLAVWSVNQTATVGGAIQGQEIRASMVTMGSTNNAGNTAGNWAAPVTASTTILGTGTAPQVAYTTIAGRASSADTAVAGYSYIRKAANTGVNHVYFVYFDRNGGTNGGQWVYKRMRWNSANHNWSTGFTAAQVVSQMQRAGSDTGYSLKYQLVSQLAEDTLNNNVYCGVATWKDNANGDTQSFFQIPASDTPSALIDVYSAGGAHVYAPVIDVSYDQPGGMLLVTYEISGAVDANYGQYAVYNGTTLRTAGKPIYRTHGTDIPLLASQRYTYAGHNYMIGCFRWTLNTPTPPYHGFFYRIPITTVTDDITPDKWGWLPEIPARALAPSFYAAQNFANNEYANVVPPPTIFADRWQQPALLPPRDLERRQYDYPTAFPDARPAPWAIIAQNLGISVGNGFTDVSPKQLVRTSGDILYVMAQDGNDLGADNNGAISRIHAYKANKTGVPASFAEQDSAHAPGFASGSGTQGVTSVACVIDGNDLIHVFYIAKNAGTGTMVYIQYNTSTDLWSTSLTLDSGTGWTDGQGTEGIAAAADSNGKLHVCYTVFTGGIRRINYLNNTSGSWSSATVIDSPAPSGSQWAYHPTLVFDTNGQLLLSWFIGGTSNGGNDGTVYVRTRTAGGTWNSSVQVSVTNDARTSIDNGPSLYIGTDNTYHLTYINQPNDHVRYWYSTDSGVTWTGNDPGGGTQSTHDPSIGPGPAGKVRIYGHGTPNPIPDGTGTDIHFFEGAGQAGTWSAFNTYVASGATDCSVNTRWAQYFYNSPNTIDIAYWFSAYPNLLDVATQVYGASFPSSASIPLDRWIGYHPDILYDLKRLQYQYPWLTIDTRAITLKEAVTVDRWHPMRPDQWRDLARLQYLDPSLVQDPNAMTLHESVFTDKWNPETQRPPRDLLRLQYLYAWLTQDANALTLHELIFPDKWHPEIQRPPRDVPRVQYEDPWFWNDDYATVVPPFAGSWYPELQRPPRDIERRQYTYPTWVTDPRALTLHELIFPDKWHPLIEVPPRDLARIQYTYRSFWQDSSATLVPPVFLAHWLGWRPDSIRDLDRRQYTYPSLFQDANAMLAHESIFADKWHPLTERPPRDVTRQQYASPLFWNDNGATLIPPVFLDRWVGSRPDWIRDLQRIQYLSPSFAIDANQMTLHEQVLLDKWIGSRPDAIADLRRLQHLYPLTWNDNGFVVASALLSAWVPRLPDLPRDDRRWSQTFPSFAHDNFGSLTPPVFLDRWIGSRPEIFRDLDRRQYAYPPFVVDTSQLTAHERITLDKWIGSRPDKIWDLARLQYTYPTFWNNPNWIVIFLSGAGYVFLSRASGAILSSPSTSNVLASPSTSNVLKS